MVSKTKEERIKQLQNHIETEEKNLSRINNDIEELKNLISDIKEFTTTDSDDILAPIADGLFVKAHVKEKETFYMNVGDGVITEKTPDEALTLMKKQLRKKKQERQKKQKEIQNLYNYVEDDKILEEDDVQKPQR